MNPQQCLSDALLCKGVRALEARYWVENAAKPLCPSDGGKTSYAKTHAALLFDDMIDCAPGEQELIAASRKVYPVVDLSRFTHLQPVGVAVDAGLFNASTKRR